MLRQRADFLPFSPDRCALPMRGNRMPPVVFPRYPDAARLLDPSQGAAAYRPHFPMVRRYLGL